jgi:hypothetical protein
MLARSPGAQRLLSASLRALDGIVPALALETTDP